MSYRRDDADGGSRESSLTDAIVAAIAAERGAEVTALEPLYEAIDPDALERLFAPRPDGTPRARGRVVFELADCEVTVRGDGTVDVTTRREGTRTADSPAAADGPDGGRGDPVPESRG